MKVAIIGGGIVGLATAYNLAKEGFDVIVFEKKYLLYGASGRNSGGITAMFSIFIFKSFLSFSSVFKTST